MSRPILRRAAAVATVLSLAAAGTAPAGAVSLGNSRTPLSSPPPDQNQLIQFESKRPERVKDYRTITGLPAGVTLAGHRLPARDRRPVRRRLGLGRLPRQPAHGHRRRRGPGVHAPASPAASSASTSTRPSTRSASSPTPRQNLRLNVDEGTLLSNDTRAEPGHAARRRRRVHELVVQRDQADRRRCSTRSTRRATRCSIQNPFMTSTLTTVRRTAVHISQTKPDSTSQAS